MGRVGWAMARRLLSSQLDRARGDLRSVAWLADAATVVIAGPPPRTGAQARSTEGFTVTVIVIEPADANGSAFGGLWERAAQDAGAEGVGDIGQDDPDGRRKARTRGAGGEVGQ